MVLANKPQRQDAVTAPREFTPATSWVEACAAAPTLATQAIENLYEGTHLERRANADRADAPLRPCSITTLWHGAQKYSRERKRARDLSDADGVKLEGILISLRADPTYMHNTVLWGLTKEFR